VGPAFCYERQVVEEAHAATEEEEEDDEGEGSVILNLS
jgi:hypothetical protein